MTRVPLAPPPGINSVDTTFTAEGQWVDGDNVRFYNGKPQTVGGNSSTLFTLGGTTGFNGQRCTDLFVLTRSGSAVVVYGQKGAGGSPGILAVGDTSSATARTPASLSTNADLGWCFAAWGEILLAAGRGVGGTVGGRLYEQSGSSTATHVTQAPERNVCILVTDQRQVLSFGCNEEISGTFNPMCIRGSDLEDYTDWTTTSTNNAFEHILDGGGEIITARKIGAYVAVWTTIGLFLGTFIGDPGQTYRFDKVTDGMGPVSVRSVVVYQDVAYWIDKSLHLRVWAPGQMVQTIPCPVLNPDDSVQTTSPFTRPHYMTVNTAFGEIWYVALSASGSPYAAYSILESAQAGRPVWFKGDLGPSANNTRTAMIFSGFLTMYGPAVKADLTVHSIETSGECISGAYIKSGDFNLDNGGRRVMIRSMTPDVMPLSSNASSISLTATTRAYPQSTTITTSGPHSITTATTKKDFRVSGKLAAVKFEAADTDGWRLGTPTFDVIPMGER